MPELDGISSGLLAAVRNLEDARQREALFGLAIVRPQLGDVIREWQSRPRTAGASVRPLAKER
jgi:hypothetical protein